MNMLSWVNLTTTAFIANVVRDLKKQEQQKLGKITLSRDERGIQHLRGKINF